MKKVKCIDNNGANELELEKQYYVKAENNEFYTISVREGRTANYLKRRFEVAELTIELDIIEASNMPLGTEFQILYPNGYIDNLKCKVAKSGSGNMLAWIHNEESIGGTQSIINAKFMPVKQKPVSFMEVVESNKKCRVEHELINKLIQNEECDFDFTEYNEIDDLLFEITNQYIADETRSILLDGKWYLE